MTSRSIASARIELIEPHPPERETSGREGPHAAGLKVGSPTPVPAKIYANEGIAQVVFFEADEICETSYADKKGKYQAQREITLPRI